MNRLILPENVSQREVFIAAAYSLATNTTNVEDIISYPNKGQKSNIYSNEVREKIQNTFSGAFSNLISLHIQSNICEPIIESSCDTMEAIARVANILKQEYVLS